MKVVNGHSRPDDENALVPQTFQRLPHAVMLIDVLITVQRNLHDWDIQWVLLWIESCPASALATRF